MEFMEIMACIWLWLKWILLFIFLVAFLVAWPLMEGTIVTWSKRRLKKIEQDRVKNNTEKKGTENE